VTMFGRNSVSKKIFYEKIGRRYLPVAEYDSDLMESRTKGNYLLSVYPGGSSTRHVIDPAFAPMIAAGRYAEQAISTALRDAVAMRPRDVPLTPAQMSAWDKLAKAFGEEKYPLTWPAIFDGVRAGTDAMEKEANKLMKHPAVLDAYNKFQTVCNLIKQQQKT